jgi:membrane peptidoglycan carboxypeptidase
VGARRPLTRRRAFDRHSLLLKAADGRRFYQHVGIDPLAILRAATVNLDSGGVAQGGSTITQQLVRLRGLVGREQSMNRKLREAFAAL